MLLILIVSKYMAHNVIFATRRKIFNFSERYYWFMHSPWAGGVMLVVFMVLALVLGNLPATKGWYYGILQSHFTIGFDGFALSKSIEHWINDGLMVIFFFYVGLEIKREIIAGELSSPRQAAMPIAECGARQPVTWSSITVTTMRRGGVFRWPPISHLPSVCCRSWATGCRCR